MVEKSHVQSLTTFYNNADQILWFYLWQGTPDIEGTKQGLWRRMNWLECEEMEPGLRWK